MKRRTIIIIVAIIILIILLISKCNCRNQSAKLESKGNKDDHAFILPPIERIQIPFSEFEVNAEKGDTLFYSSGSILFFPADAFTDKEGNLIKGKVKIQYREFRDPVDFFLSGIPMEYDSAGVQYNFESAGMSEINAFQNGREVFVNKQRKPQINIASNNTDPAQNLYYLDTVSKQWVNKGKSDIIILKSKQTPDVYSNNSINDIPMPVKPEKASDELPTITVRIDPESFEELKSYDNLKFQIDKTDNSFIPEHSNEIWEDIKLIKGKISGRYDIEFRKKDKKVRYKVRPVLNDEDYAKAINVYDQKIKEYQNKIKERQASVNANKAAYTKDSLQNLQIDKENEKIAAMNKIIERRNAEMEKIKKEVEAKNKEIETINIINKTESMNVRAMRSFEMDNFGVWNCDRPVPGDNNVLVQSHFTFDGAEVKNLGYAYLLVKDLNMLFRSSGHTLSVPLNRENMIVAVADGRFAYMTYDEFKNLNITSTTRQLSFPLKVVSEENNNYAYIKSLTQ